MGEVYSGILLKKILLILKSALKDCRVFILKKIRELIIVSLICEICSFIIFN